MGHPQHQRLRHRAVGGVRNRNGRGRSLGRQQTISALEPRVPFWNLLAARSEALLAIIETLWLQISPCFHLLHALGNYFKANEQHELMLAALRARDGTKVSLAVRSDIEAAYKVLASLLDAEIT